MSGIKHINWEDIPAKRKAEHENYQYNRRKFWALERLPIPVSVFMRSRREKLPIPTITTIKTRRHFSFFAVRAF